MLTLNATVILSMIWADGWIFRADGQVAPTDFVNVWSAGRVALEEHPALAYDWDVQKQLQVTALGANYVGNYAWHYPPPFLFVAALLAKLPYAWGFFVWVAISFVAYLGVMRAIVGRPFGWLMAAACPAVLANTLVGQNGFLTAALMGGTLLLLPTRPVLSGVCLGLLSYKPQYGVLFPLVLIAAAQWRVFCSAAVVTVTLALLSALAFGIDSWQAFLHWMPTFAQAFFIEGRATWFKLQSVFGLLRTMGGSEQLAWTGQWIVSVVVAVSLAWLWRSRADYALKAAALVTGTLLVSPYLFLYDMVALAIPVALLVCLGLAGGFGSYELPALGFAALLLLCFPLVDMPTGVGSTLIVAGLIARRAADSWLTRGAATASDDTRTRHVSA